jgi:mRNA-degrading endonuclease RelE of RelBE toxin-antitoxin system
MSWKIEIKPTTEKSYLKLRKKIRKKVKEALLGLQNADNPFLNPNVRPLTGTLHGDYRLRVGKWRILFTPNRKNKTLHVYAILPRGDGY